MVMDATGISKPAAYQRLMRCKEGKIEIGEVYTRGKLKNKYYSTTTESWEGLTNKPRPLKDFTVGTWEDRNL
jgi:hypothetical protein